MEKVIMSLAGFYQDPYKKELTTLVRRVENEWVTVEETIFYPQGGGQPGDTGIFLSPKGLYRVVDTRKGELPGIIRHQLNSADHGLAEGDEITLRLDWGRRYRHMQMHTAMHLLGSLIPVPVTGGSVGEHKSRLDFDLGDHEIDKDALTLGINRLIDEAHDVTFESITDDELDAKPELVRTMSVQPPRGSGTIRMVRVKEVDFQPCGGTHVSNTSEIGRIQIAKIENKGKRNRRVHVVWADASQS